MSVDVPPTVFIVDDDPDMRHSIEFLMQSVRIATMSYASAAEFLADFHPSKSGCLICDVRMPEMSGLDLFEKLDRMGSRIPVILMTAYADVPMAIRALKLGVADFVEKPFSAQHMLEGVQRAITEDHVRRESLKSWQEFTLRMDSLTDKERATLEQIISGSPNKTIAAQLAITERAVEVRRASIMKKLDVNSTPELVRRVTRYQLLCPSPNSIYSVDQGGET